MIYTLPHKPELNDWITADPSRVSLILERLTSALKAGGYVVGPGGVNIFPEGIQVDADRDPSADWASFDVIAYRSTQETAREGRRAAVESAIATLRADATNLDNAGLTITTLQFRQGLARTNRSLALLIEYLAEQDVIDVVP